MKFTKAILAFVCLMCGTLLAQEAKGNRPYVERPAKLSRERGADDYRGISARQCRPNPSTQCKGLYLCARRHDRDAGERRKGSDSDRWSDLLCGAGRCSRRWEECEQDRAREICCV